ncbi:MAG TPA: NADH:ubiquinone oxidoreductase subunit NDUFA12 [Alphaproteobacteria bacterium]|nr:NADH:ubiquinone oxidoreductase subunit NDUFA12 [Alphaproteobacteria bacterium]
MASIGTKLFTLFFGQKVGEDVFGNIYYQTRKPQSTVGRYNKNRRWVIFNGKNEPSKVPAEWHGWLHFSFDEIPDIKVKGYYWQKSHTPNLTGSDLMYLPYGHKESIGKREKATGDYKPWKPNQ